MNIAVYIAKAVIVAGFFVLLAAMALVGIFRRFNRECGDVCIHHDRGHRCTEWGKHKVHRDEYGFTWARRGDL